MKFKVGNEVIVKMSRLSETEEQCGLDTRMLQMRGKKYFITDTARAASIEEQKQPIYRLDNRFFFLVCRTRFGIRKRNKHKHKDEIRKI
jgi:hypothetical protein